MYTSQCLFIWRLSNRVDCGESAQFPLRVQCLTTKTLFYSPFEVILSQLKTCLPQFGCSNACCGRTLSQNWDSKLKLNSEDTSGNSWHQFQSKLRTIKSKTRSRNKRKGRKTHLRDQIKRVKIHHLGEIIEKNQKNYGISSIKISWSLELKTEDILSIFYY